jgi:hypothetical protein
MFQHVFRTKWGKRGLALGVAVTLGAGATSAFAYLVAPSGGNSTFQGNVQTEPTQNVALTVESASYSHGQSGFEAIGDQETVHFKAQDTGTLPTILHQITLVSWTSGNPTCDAAAGAGSFVASPVSVGMSLTAGNAPVEVSTPLVITLTDTQVDQSCLEGATITFDAQAS